MMATTPSGTRTRWISSPLGRRHPSSTSPTGSGSVATWRRPAAIPAMRASVRRSRSSGASSMPTGGSRLEIGGVGRDQVGGSLPEELGGGEEGGVLRCGRRAGQHAGRGDGPPPELGDRGGCGRGHAPSLILDRSVNFWKCDRAGGGPQPTLSPTRRGMWSERAPHRTRPDLIRERSNQRWTERGAAVGEGSSRYGPKFLAGHSEPHRRPLHVGGRRFGPSPR